MRRPWQKLHPGTVMAGQTCGSRLNAAEVAPRDVLAPESGWDSSSCLPQRSVGASSAISPGGPTSNRSRAARTPNTAPPVGSDTAGSGDPWPTAHTAETSIRGGSRRCVSGGTCRTTPAAPRTEATFPLAIGPGIGGEGGIRTHEVFRLSAFQERRHQPLGHLSGESVAVSRAMTPVLCWAEQGARHGRTP